MPTYKACPYNNQHSEKPKWCICINGSPNPDFGIFDSPESAEAKANELLASYAAFEGRIKNEDGKLCAVDTKSSMHTGPIVQTDGIHALQSLGRRKYAIHMIDVLDKVLTLDDKSTSIRYRNGHGILQAVTVDHQKSR